MMPLSFGDGLGRRPELGGDPDERVAGLDLVGLRRRPATRRIGRARRRAAAGRGVQRLRSDRPSRRRGEAVAPVARGARGHALAGADGEAPVAAPDAPPPVTRASDDRREGDREEADEDRLAGPADPTRKAGMPMAIRP